MPEPDVMNLQGKIACESKLSVSEKILHLENTLHGLPRDCPPSILAEVCKQLYDLNALKNSEKKVRNSFSGLFPLFEDNEPTPQPTPYNACTLPDIAEFQGVSNNIYVSDSEESKGNYSDTPPHPKNAKLKNRKYVTRDDTLSIDGTDYKINVTAKSGVFPKILKEAHAELQWMIEKYKKVHIHFFDLRFSERYSIDIPSDSQWVRKLFKNAKRKINRHYGTKHIGHLWVREQERSKSQHYHCMVIVDGKKTRFPHYLKKVIEKEWFSISGGSLAWPKKCYYNLNSRKESFQSIKAEIVYRISYRAKERGKGYRPPQAKDYRTSKLASIVSK